MKRFVLIASLMLVVSAVATPSASAASRFFAAEQENTFFFGTAGLSGFEFNAGVVACQSVIYEGFQQPKSAQTLTLSPTFEKCEIGGNKAVTVKMNGCSFLLHSEREIAGLSIPPVMDIVCKDANGTETGPIVISWEVAGTLKCEVTVGSQTGLLKGGKAGLAFTNNFKKPISFTTAFDLDGIAYTQHAGSGAGACTGESDVDGAFVSTAKLLGHDSKNFAVGVFYQ
jgi:hypothetical protein